VTTPEPVDRDRLPALDRVAARTTAAEAYYLLQLLAEKHGWAYGTRDRSDVEHHLGRALTDPEWAAVESTYEWDQYFDELDAWRMDGVLQGAGVAAMDDDA
jgi:hypothetical protein